MTFSRTAPVTQHNFKAQRAYARIIGTGAYLPSRVLTNDDIAKRVDTSDEWIVTRTGIKQRHIAEQHESVVSMAEKASLQALKNANLKPNQVDLIIVATSTPARLFPSTACLLQRCLAIPACPAFDVNAACAGFSYALHVANQFIQQHNATNVLVIGSEVMSRIVDWSDRKTCILFGDGAGAVVLSRDQTTGILASHLSADGQYADLLYTQNQDEETKLANLGYVQMQGNDVFKLAVKTLSQLVAHTMQLADLSLDQLNWLVPHQANIRIIEACARKCQLSIEQVILTISQHGNTSAASIPLALHQGIMDGRIQKKDVVLLESFGAGFSWGAAVMRY